MIGKITTATVFANRDGRGVTYFHPRATVVPAPGEPRLVMTLQQITGSDFYHVVRETLSSDGGRSWTAPRALSAFDREDVGGGVEEGVCDVVPEYHPGTHTVLAMGHNVFYRDGRLLDTLGDFVAGDARVPRQRCIVYAVRDGAGRWQDRRQKLSLPGFEDCTIVSCGCAQRVTLADGTLLIPITFGRPGQRDRTVCCIKAAFDGTSVRFLQRGGILRHEYQAGRGFLEPSLVSFEDRYYLTIRAEDDHGYVAVSSDGLTWERPCRWSWDNGDFPAMSTTQQRWLVHRGKLYLVYTRRRPDNRNVMRWRAPLLIAEVDPQSLELRRGTEQVIFPLSADGVHAPEDVAHLGNFHASSVSPSRSIVTVGEVLPEHQFRGDTLLALLE